MSDPAAALLNRGYRPPNRKKWILIGCGCLSTLFLVMGGGIFAVVWMFKQQIAQFDPIGAAYLRAAPEVRQELGDVTATEVQSSDFQVHWKNNRGAARLAYTLQGARGSATAVVFFASYGDRWRAVGCELRAGAKTLQIGQQIELPRSSGD